MNRPLKTIEFPGQMILLGTGTSVGVPMIGCPCAVCQSSDPRDNRSRCSAVLGLPEGNLLIDTSPDLRSQLLREDIGLVHAVLFTHEHADHIFGLDDLRLFLFYLGHPIPLYCEDQVSRRIQHSFDYAFSSREPTHPGAVPRLEIRTITTEPVEILGRKITPIRLQHGPRFEVLGFRFGNVAYCTDTNHIPETSLPLLEGLDVLILDALRNKSHPTHFSLQEAIAVTEQLKPKRALFTHCSHDLSYQATNAILPDNVELAYDGQRIPLT